MADETALWLKTHPGAPEEDAVLSLYFDVLRYLKVAELYDGHYRTLLTFAKGDITIRQFCVDPSALLSDAFPKGGRRLFFGHAAPLPYYRELLGAGGRRSPSSPLPFPTREPLPAHRRPGQHPVQDRPAASSRSHG